MQNDDRPPDGLIFKKAKSQLVSEKTRERWRAGGNRINWNRRVRYHSSFIGPGNPEDRLHATGVSKFKAAERAVVREFWGLVTAGDLVAIGHPGSPDKHAEIIPPGEWQWLAKGSKDGSTFEGGGRTWYRVLFYRRENVEGWRPKKALAAAPRERESGDAARDALVSKQERVKQETPQRETSAPAPKRKSGRPTRREEIKEAFNLLCKRGALCDCETLRQLYPLVRAEVCRAAPDKGETGLQDEAIRKVISKPFQEFIRSRKSAHKL